MVHNGGRFTLKEAVETFWFRDHPGMHEAVEYLQAAGRSIASSLTISKGRFPTTCTRTREARNRPCSGREGKPESYYFPPQLNWTGNHFPYTFMGLEPGTTKADIHRCLERWNQGDNGILDHSKAYRLKPGTGWLIPPCVLHAPGSLLTYEPQWGSDVFGMYQSMVEGRRVPWELLVKDVPDAHHQDIDYLVEQLDWAKNVDPEFKKNNYLEPINRSGGDSAGYVDKWIVYGRVDSQQLFSACELTVEPGRSISIKDPGAYGLIVDQGSGLIGKLAVDSPNFIRIGEITEDEVFVTSKLRASEGVLFHNTGSEPFVSLRYFGPDVHADLPAVGDHAKKPK